MRNGRLGFWLMTDTQPERRFTITVPQYIHEAFFQQSHAMGVSMNSRIVEVMAKMAGVKVPPMPKRGKKRVEAAPPPLPPAGKRKRKG